MNISKKASTTVKRNLGSLCLLLFGILLFGNIDEVQAQDQYLINHIYTDYLDFWSSGVGKISDVRPDKSHNLLGFTVGNTTYSTGVADAVLTSYGVFFKPMNFQALPVVNIPITNGSSRFAMFGEMQDGLHNEVLEKGIMPFPYPSSVTLYDMLTDGIQGLDISTSVTNMTDENDNPVEMEFPTNIENPNHINDGIPDILVTQTADPSNNDIDKLWFTDGAGNLIGQIVEINQNDLKPLGETMSDFYNPEPKKQETANFINSSRKLRISAYDISEFGIDLNNFDEAEQLIYKMGGSSDPAFVAFNTELINILVANNDVIQMDINTQEKPNSVEIDILENDHFPSHEDQEITITEGPSNGTVTIDESTNRIVYVPPIDFTGVATFKYKVCQGENCDFALVTVVVGAADLEVTKEMAPEVPVDDEMTFTVTVKNNGPYDALFVQVNDLLPAGYILESYSVSAGSYSQQTGVWFVGTLALNNSATLIMDVSVNAEGPYTNTAIGESVNFDPNLDNNEASVTPGNLPSASLQVGCNSGFELQQVTISLTGEGPWKLVYDFNGEVVPVSVQTSPLTLNMQSRGSFYLMSVKDYFGNKVEYDISPTSRMQVNPCYVVSNPMMRSRAGK